MKHDKRAYRVDRLVNQLMRPIFVLQMARGGEHYDSPWGKSCRTRAAKARKEIAEVVEAWVHE